MERPIFVEGAPDKPSELFRQVRIAPVQPSVGLLSSSPFRPISYEVPPYPVLAKIIHISGSVTVTLHVNSDGSASNVGVLDGHSLLRSLAEATGQAIQAVVEFKPNCPPKGP